MYTCIHLAFSFVCSGGFTWAINILAEMDQSLFCPAWMIPFSENGPNMQYAVEELTFQFELPGTDGMQKKEVKVAYPILQGNDSMCFVGPSEPTSKAGSVKIFRGLLHLVYLSLSLALGCRCVAALWHSGKYVLLDCLFAQAW